LGRIIGRETWEREVSTLMHKRIGLLTLVGALLWGLPTGGATAEATDGRAWLLEPFARETVILGDEDVDAYAIEHVFEVQWRLNRLGYFHKYPTGTFGYGTRRAVKDFQRDHDLRATGSVNRPTWVVLIKLSTHAKARVPDACREPGWHACYNRTFHEVSLFHNGTLHNSWLVRGGASYSPTQTGDFVVGQRDEDHVSSAYDSPMPYSQFFDGDRALHGSGLMVDPYDGHSHGCVNLYIEDARQLWLLTSELRLYVHVYGAWD
jgi:hypothetical protein